MRDTRLDVTTFDDAANGIRRELVISAGGEVHEDVVMGGADTLRLEPVTTSETVLPERWR